MPPVHVQLVDPPAYSPPYDHSLAAALARAGADVELLTSRYPYGAAPDQGGYAVREHFYGRATAAGRGTSAGGRCGWPSTCRACWPPATPPPSTWCTTSG